MSILFTCGRCGKDYELSEELSGRRVRCKACGSISRLPETGPWPPDDDGGYEVEPGPGAAATAPPPLPTAAQLNSGSRVDVLRVGESTSDRLVLETRAATLVLQAVKGGVLLVVGIVLCLMLEQYVRGVRQPTRLYILFILLPYAFVAMGLERVGDLVRLDYRVTFDRPSRSLTLQRLGAWEYLWSADDLAGVAFVITTFTDSRTQTCEAYVLDADGRPVAWLGRTRTAIADARPVARAAINAAWILDVPIQGRCYSEPGFEHMAEALHLVNEAAARYGPYDLPRVRHPFLSLRNLRGAIWTVFTLATLRFLFVYCF